VTTTLRTLAHKLGKSILISTHELDLALGWADTIWLLDRSGAITAKAPEDLILDGDIERVFGDPRLRFDQERGEFSIAEESGQQIHLTGEGLRYIWTCRALHRLGYGIISGDLPPETSSITISEAGWTLRTPTGITTQHHSITALLSALGERSASVY
jgi:putative iron compound ABC transporter ATP-binding protein